MEETALPLKLDGLNIDQVYENFVRQIAGKALNFGTSETLKKAVEKDNYRQELQKQIAALQVKVRREKQFNKQVELNMELKRLRRQFDNL